MTFYRESAGLTRFLRFVHFALELDTPVVEYYRDIAEWTPLPGDG